MTLSMSNGLVSWATKVEVGAQLSEGAGPLGDPANFAGPTTTKGRIIIIYFAFTNKTSTIIK